MASVRPYVGTISASNYLYGFSDRRRRPQMNVQRKPPAERPPQNPPPPPPASDKPTKKYTGEFAGRKVLKRTIKMPKGRKKYIPTTERRIVESKTIRCDVPLSPPPSHPVYEPIFAKRETESRTVQFTTVAMAAVAFKRGAKKGKMYKPTTTKRIIEAKKLKCPHPRPRTVTPALIPYYRSSPVITDPLTEARQPVVPIFREPPEPTPSPQLATPLHDPMLRDYGPRPPFVYYFHDRSPTPEPIEEITEAKYVNTFQEAKYIKTHEREVHFSPTIPVEPNPIQTDRRDRSFERGTIIDLPKVSPPPTPTEPETKRTERTKPDPFDKGPTNYFSPNPRPLDRSARGSNVPHFTAVGSILRGFEYHGY